MNISKQIQLHSIDDRAFYTEKEQKINQRILDNANRIKDIETYLKLKAIGNEKYKYDTIENLKKAQKNKYIKKNITTLLKQNTDIKESAEYINVTTNNQGLTKELEKLNISKNELIEKLNEEIEKNKDTYRKLDSKKLTKYNTVSLFNSALIRTLNIEINTLTTDIFIVEIIKYNILQQLLYNNFDYNNEEYVYLTSSAGQIRNKKCVFIKKSLLDNVEKTLMCGLTIDNINNSKEKGININKFLSYMALNNSATEVWEDFDINKAIVIEDWETKVKGKIDYVDNKTFEVTPKEMNVPIPHSDGCGWVLSTVKNRNFMIRLPWIKGLLTPVNYMEFCKEYNNSNYKITDIYGKEWDLKEDNIQVVFSKSQLKLWKYYSNCQYKNGEIFKYGWDKYKENFKKYRCTANICNEEEDTFRKAHFNYQMLQTLTDMTDKEINDFIEPVKETIELGYKDRDTMLRLLGSTGDNPHKSYFQQCIEIYPEMVQDPHVKDELASKIASMKEKACYGKIKINGRYTFLIPDVFAWMSYVFCGKDDYLLDKGQVFCKLYKNQKKLLVNRSPHLYMEHCVRNNIIDKEKSKWLITNGVYTSCHDLISKTLQFDNDGDKALVIAGEITEIAERNMKDILPLYYKMGKADPVEINADNIYDALTTAFKYGNIGKYSNKLTKIWNSKEKDIEIAKVITALNNFSIDAAKTLEMPTPEDKLIKKKIKNIDDYKLPYFFKYAKDKDTNTLAPIDITNTVDNICNKIESINNRSNKYNFNSLGRFRYVYLMSSKDIKLKDLVINEEIIAKYEELDKEKDKYFSDRDEEEKKEITSAVYLNMRTEFSKCWIKNNINYIDAVDMVIKHVFTAHKAQKKTLLFNLFGHTILQNLQNNINKPLNNGYIMCTICGTRIKKQNNSQKYCKKCAAEQKKGKDKI